MSHTAPPPPAAPQLAAHIGTPPADVRHMLERHGCQLPQYYDLHLLRAAMRAHARWPLLDAAAYE